MTDHAGIRASLAQTVKSAPSGDRIAAYCEFLAAKAQLAPVSGMNPR